MSIPDPGLNAAIREALQQPGGPLTEPDLLSLTNLLAGGRQIRSAEGLEAARNLRILDLDDNSVTNFPVADALTNLTILDLFKNDLSRFVLSSPLPKLTILDIALNSLTQCSLPPGLTNLDTLFLEGNALTNFSMPAGLTRLKQLDLSDNQLSTLTLPPDLTQLRSLFLGGNPLTTLVLSEPLAMSLSNTVASLENQGVSVFTYPPDLQLLRPRPLTGAVQFGITGPPGTYVVLGSTNLLDWTQAGVVANPLGAASFVDTNAHSFPWRYYRAVQAPANMVFVPPGTFLLGSPTNDLDGSIDERPQTTVTLTRGFWIGKFEVTQGEYLSLMYTNPSEFPGDLSRPVSSLSWPDATNYCWKLTQREIAAGHIPPGSQYRLPTEAEWEYAARAGTTTRFSYGDDPGYASLTNYAWFLDLGVLDLTVHPVGQKLPNPWGLHDMYGNVWEWCQDWYGPLPGGAVTDPRGATSNPLGFKVMRGGAYDYGQNSCRSSSRLFQNHEDTDLGFRVVLVIGS